MFGCSGKKRGEVAGPKDDLGSFVVKVVVVMVVVLVTTPTRVAGRECRDLVRSRALFVCGN